MTQILVDGNGLAWRCACAVPATISSGTEFGIIRSIMSLMRQHPNCHIRCIWDGNCTWRREIFPDYKGKDTRDDPFKTELYRKMQLFRTIFSWVLPQYEGEGCEADDVISAFCYLVDPADDILIYSPDTDFQQLVCERVKIIRPRQKQELQTLDMEWVKNEWQVRHPSDLRWLRAFTGCKSDIVPGCGVPKKKLAQIVSGIWADELDPVKKILTELEALKIKAGEILTQGWLKRFLEFQRRVIRNYRIMTLAPPRTDSYIKCTYDPDFDRFYQWCIEAGMMTILPTVINYFGHPPEKETGLEQSEVMCSWATHTQMLKIEDEQLGELTQWQTEGVK